MSTRTDVLQVATDLIKDCAGYETDQSEEYKKLATDYYFQRKRGDERPGRSAVVGGDVSSMVEATLAQMMASFSSDRIAEFKADNADDEDQAQLETDIVTDCIMDDNDGYTLLETAIKSALLYRNGIVKVYPESVKDVYYKEFDGVTVEAYAALVLSDTSTNVEVVKWDQAKGYLKLKETTEYKALKARNVENFLYTKNWDQTTLEGIPCCGERHVETRSDLIKREFNKDLVNRLDAYSPSSQSNDAKNPKSESAIKTSYSDSSMDEIEWYEIYAHVDEDGDGIAELRKICFVPNQAILENVEVQMNCYASGSCLINPNRFLGISLFDKLKQVQDVSTGLQRGLLDNVMAINDGRIAYDNKVNQDDVNGEVWNANIRVKADSTSGVGLGAHILQMPQVDATGGILAAIQNQNAVRSELGGASLDMAQGHTQLSSKVGSEGLDRAYSVMEQLAALMTKNIAETLIKGVFKLVHKTYRLHFNDDISNKRRGEWVTSNPQKWPPRKRLTVKIGLSAGERSRKRGALRQIMEDQMVFSQAGLDDVLVDVDTFYKSQMDWARLSEVDNPEQYYINPNTDASKAAMEANKNAVAANAKQQKELTARTLQLEELAIRLDSKDKERDRAIKVFEAELRAEIEEMKLTGTVTADLEKMKLGSIYGKTDK